MCVSVCVCPYARQCVPVRSPLAAGRCAGNRKRQCEHVGVCLWDYEKLPACSAAWVDCEATARERCGGGGAWGGHRSSPQTTLSLMKGEEGSTPWDAEHERIVFVCECGCVFDCECVCV